MLMHTKFTNEDAPISVTSVRQLVNLGTRQDLFISNVRFETIDEILKRIPRGTVSLSRERRLFEEKWQAKIQVIKPDLCGTDDNSIRLLNGDPDIKREISRRDEKELIDFLQEQGFDEATLGDHDNEVCARYFIRRIVTSRPIQ